MNKVMIDTGNTDGISGVLVLVKGRSASGEAQYAYVAIASEKYDAFLRAQAAGAYDLSKFGTILCYGSGLEPPIEVQTQMEEKYGASHTFQKQLTDAMYIASS